MPLGLKLFNRLKKWVIINKFILLILLFYFILNLINLTKLPIFNDESIYLSWGWVQTHWAGHEYDSMYDGKQPLMIWLFGVFSNFLEPLFAGRFVSVAFGGITLIGLYLTTKKLFNKNSAYLSSIVFSVSPIFVFYNRQALLESGIICVGIWAFYAILNLIEKPTNKNGIILGIILGLGFLMKSTSLIFIIVSAVIISFYIYWRRRNDLVKPSLVSIATLISVDLLILINPVFWQTLASNNRYSFTFSEILRFPVNAWINNFLGFLEIGFFLLTPIVFVTGVFGLYIMIKKRVSNFKLFITFFLSILFLELILTRSQGTRYIVPFLIFLIISSSYFLESLWRKNLYKKILLISLIIILLVVSAFQVISPKLYLSELSKFTRFSEAEYLQGQTSGVGVDEAFNYIKKDASGKPSFIFLGLNAGNPEDAINAYSFKTDNLLTLRMDSKLFNGLDKFECISSEYPAYFVTRSNELLGMEKFFKQEKTFSSSENYYIGIYALKKCDGEKLPVLEMYGDGISAQFGYRPDLKAKFEK
ncbi:MAG: glycosyltransferase family 39 protein [Candidatus Levybacteria bacterium]|nr:glycosyltransferase family 39 protein [Candidatus Levybacteria bacterium]